MKRSSSSKKKRPPRIDPADYEVSPEKSRRILMVVTAAIAAVVLGVFVFLSSQGTLGGRNTEEYQASQEVRRAREAARSHARIVAGERSIYWNNVVLSSPSGWAPAIQFIRDEAEGLICQDNPEVDGKLLTLDEMRKVAILRERQCLQHLRPTVIAASESPEVVRFIDQLIYDLGEEYSKP